MMNDLEKFDEAMKKLNDDYNNSQKKINRTNTVVYVKGIRKYK